MAVDKLVDSAQLDADLEDIADAIRTKGGTSAQMAFPAGFVSAVQAIPTGITPTGTKQITANGSNIDVESYKYADVAVPNSYSAGDEGKVVSNGALVAQSSDTVTTNDTYDTTLINSLTVNVSGGGDTFKDYLEDTNNLIINSNATSVKPGGITGENVKAIILPECTSLANGAICYASYTNGSKYFKKLEELKLPKVESLGTMSLCGFINGCTLNSVVLPSLKTITWSASNGRAFDFDETIIKWDFGNPSITSMSWGSGTHFYRCSASIEAIIFRYGGVVAIGSAGVFRYNNTTNLPLGTTTFIYVPSDLLAQYKTATNWSSLYANYPDMFKTIEGSYYETHYADGTVIS